MASNDPGEAAVTIYDIARHAGVSTASVSRVLKGTGPSSRHIRASVRAAADELGYVPQRTPASPPARHEAQGLVLPGLHGHFTELLLGHESAAGQLGQSLSLMVTAGRQDAAAALRDLARRVDGLVLASSTVPDAAVQTLARSLPVVLLGRPAVPGCDTLLSENVRAAQELTAHLLRHGRTHLVFVGDPDSSPNVADRYRGFRLAHAAAGRRMHRPPLRVPLVERAGISIADEILHRRVRVDGLFCASDTVAVAVLKRLCDNGVAVPEDMVVTGWDDAVTARHMTPGLTSVRQPMRELGRMAASRLHRRAAGEPAASRPEVLPAELVLRGSCGCPPKREHARG